MEQEENRGEENKPQPQPQPPQPQPHQKCPRCESQNTKFCYYNNYSLSQPRYYCKACRRYWTHGGTLRNIPVGGGSRKGKRAKSSSASASNSSENSSSMSSHQQPPQPPAVVQTQPNSMAKGPPSSAMGSQPPVGPYYHGGGGYLSCLAAIHSLNPSQPSNQSLNLGSSSNSGLLSGFNVANSLSSQNQQQRQFRPSLQFYQTGNRHREVESLYAPNSSMANSHPEWLQRVNDSANRRGSDTSLWSTINTTSISGANSDSDNVNTAGSSYLIPNQWPDMPGYGPP